MFPELKPDDCPTCWGCGKVANDEDQSPWIVWAKMPLESAIAVQMGLVRPIECPDCKGAGKRKPAPPTKE